MISLSNVKNTYINLLYKYRSAIFINDARLIDESINWAHENQKNQDFMPVSIGEDFLQTDTFVHGFRSRRSSGSIQWLSVLDSRSIRLVFVRAMATVSRPSLLQSRMDTRDGQHCYRSSLCHLQVIEINWAISMAFMGRFYRMLRIWNHGLHPGERHCWLTNAHNFASNFDYRHEIYRLHTFIVVCLLNDSQMSALHTIARS